MDNKVVSIESKNSNITKSENWISKIGHVLSQKNFKIVVLIVVGLMGFLLIANLYFDDSSNQKQTTSSKSAYLSTLDYCAELENKLQNLIENIKGAGNVRVMITVEGSPEIIYLSDNSATNSTNMSGATTSTNTSSPIIVEVGGQDSALIRTENLPKVKGVIVVSSGASDVAVKLDILNAVSTLLGISNEQISVLKGI